MYKYVACFNSKQFNFLFFIGSILHLKYSTHWSARGSVQTVVDYECFDRLRYTKMRGGDLPQRQHGVTKRCLA